ASGTLAPLFETKPGEVLGPLGEGPFLVVKVTARRPADEKDLGQFRAGIEKGLQKGAEEKRSNEYLAELRAKHVQVDEKLLDLLPPAVEGLSGDLTKDTRVLAQVGEDKLTLGEVATAIANSAKSLGELTVKEAARNCIASWANSKVVDAESLARHYELTDKGTAAGVASFERDTVLGMYKSQVVGPRLHMDKAAQEAYYEAHKEEYLKPLTFKLRQISADTQEDAERILDELKQGADFAWLARARSTDDHAEKGGQMGWVKEDSLNKDMAGTVKGLAVGETSGAIPSGSKYLIIKMEAKEEKDYFTLPDVRERLLADLYREQEKAASRAVADELRQGATIEINEESIEVLVRRYFPPDSSPK
ncbi:MAG: peptidyl-prolyl cis-trans isomerase, partial [Pseudomonadota bacterium]